jgi:hypothetical protein
MSQTSCDHPAMDEDETKTHRVTYTGNPSLVGLLAHLLRQDGLEVQYEPPMEERGLSDVPQDVLVGVLVTGTSAAIKAGLKAARDYFHERFPRTRIEDEDQGSED